MTPENNQHTDNPGLSSEQDLDTAQKQESLPHAPEDVLPANGDLPPYATTVNGGVVPPNPYMAAQGYGYPNPYYYPYGIPQPNAVQPTMGQPITAHPGNTSASMSSTIPTMMPGTTPTAMPAMIPTAAPAATPSTVSPTIPNQYDQQDIKRASTDTFDYDHIATPARIAIYDNLHSAPRVIQIEGASTHEYIERIASQTYKQAKEAGGIIPYTVIREVSENFIHAHFKEVVVSIMDGGNTIRFADQGPGIHNKELVQEPGFSSATEPMKRYIRGVGSGLPIVRDYLDTAHGYIEIEDNINQGSVVTISLVAARSIHDKEPIEVPKLTRNEKRILQELFTEGELRITDVVQSTGISNASVYNAFQKLEKADLVHTSEDKKRKLTEFGQRIASTLE